MTRMMGGTKWEDVAIRLGMILNYGFLLRIATSSHFYVTKLAVIPSFSEGSPVPYSQVSIISFLFFSAYYLRNNPLKTRIGHYNCKIRVLVSYILWRIIKYPEICLPEHGNVVIRISNGDYFIFKTVKRIHNMSFCIFLSEVIISDYSLFILSLIHISEPTRLGMI